MINVSSTSEVSLQKGFHNLKRAVLSANHNNISK